MGVKAGATINLSRRAGEVKGVHSPVKMIPSEDNVIHHDRHFDTRPPPQSSPSRNKLSEVQGVIASTQQQHSSQINFNNCNVTIINNNHYYSPPKNGPPRK